ncbi:hypothetical protein LTR36_002708 [Oleoguttula mirabilis]|uniref:F-box domain-containing protein n=1 Tax=Oleoguttula mirabilis TaxID=1507867 RepID=A0AAV9JKF2_9PEZI|nr:hypothetical protein LTR36_002708 [Oleoguttula mirabilis]
MSQIVRSTENTPASLRNGLSDAQGDVQGLKQFFSNFLSPTLYNEITPPQNESIACRVFEVPELLELILLELPVADIMSFQQVDRNARDAIEASSPLQRALSLRADPADSPVRMPFNDMTGLRGFSCGERKRPSRRLGRLPWRDDEIQIKAYFTSNSGPLPRIGLRWRRMYALQPPIREMIATVLCCQFASLPGVSQTVTSECGITVGDLYDAAQQAWLEHRQCVNAASDDHDENGLVKVQVIFSTTLALKPDNPIFLRRQREEARGLEKAEEWSNHHGLMQAYIAYKRSGRY